MRGVEEARSTLRERLQRDMSGWAASPDNFSPLKFALHPPTEKQAIVNQQAAIDWVAEWRHVSDKPEFAGTVTWEERAWSRVGRQSVPVRFVLKDAEVVARFVGGEPAARFKRMKDRATHIREVCGESAAVAGAIRANGQRIVGLSDVNFDRVLEVVTWLGENPVGQLRPRQLPIRGVDSKWFSAHKTVVTALLKACGREDAVSVLEPEPRLRARFLDPQLAPCEALCDVTAPVDELARMEIEPETVFVFENLESVLSMPSYAGAVVIHGGGYSVDLLARLPWLHASRVVYWGDLDSHGFAILAKFRNQVPGAVSILMDVETLMAHRDLWVEEPKPHTGSVVGLTSSEERALARVRTEGNVRLEQERIPWKYALAAIAPRVLDQCGRT